MPACGPGAIDFEQKDEVVELDVGAIIMATGFELWDPAQESRYGYGRLDNVITSLEFERISNASGPTGGEIVCKNGEAPKSVAILHCVGSRDENYQEFCSRVCCMYSLKFSHLIKEHLPETEVYELYIDMRCYGKNYEEFYKRLMDEGVNFVRGRAAEVTDVALSPDEEGRLVVKTEDTLLGIVRRIPADMVILSAGLSPAHDAKEVSQVFGFGCSSNGFYLERHPKLEPVADRHRRHLHRRLLPVPQGHPRHGRPGGRRGGRRAGPGRQRHGQGRTDHLLHRSREVLGLPHLRGPVPAQRDPVQRREGRSRGDRGGLQGLWRVRFGLRLQRAAAARLPRQRRSSPRSKGRSPSRRGATVRRRQ